ncbi:MAG: DUF5666 domain-containing protein [Candidatus Woesebacteria bacterium]|nr:DUF5666 domain-containing protein [Candidatus Woesebacteria bacterium]
MKNIKVIVPIILVLVGLGAGFFGGYQYRNYRLNQTRGNFAAGGANGNFQRFTGTRNGQGTVAGARGGAVTGSILSMDAKSITVKLTDGSTKIVLFSGSTTYSNTVTASQTDLKVGSEVAVFGAANTDGSVTATNIQINPMSFRPQGSPAPTLSQ